MAGRDGPMPVGVIIVRTTMTTLAAGAGFRQRRPRHVIRLAPPPAAAPAWAETAARPAGAPNVAGDGPPSGGT